MGLIGRMLERGTENGGAPPPPTPSGTVVAPRFARDDSHFAVRAGDQEVAG